MTDRAARPASVLTVNAGSSSVKYALYELSDGAPRRVHGGRVEHLGAAGNGADPVPAAEAYALAGEKILGALADDPPAAPLVGVGHRVVHGGLEPHGHQCVTDGLLETLRGAQPLDLAHLPAEIALIELFRARLPDTPQVACFDSVFHHGLPRVAQLLPIPRRFDAHGVRRLGFHGLSFAYLMEALTAIDARAARGRVVLAHLGSGASLAAVHAGRPIDTSMAFTPTAGLVMATRPGDLDPGVLVYLLRRERLDPAALDDLVSNRSGLLGVSETTGDMEVLLRARATDPRAAEAVDLFCYQARKWVGAFAAALGGLDTLVFSGGIGEHAPAVRAAIADGLGFLGLALDAERNAANAAVISSAAGRVTARVIPTDEELMIARTVARLLGLAVAASPHSV
jgi:acetate kinase